MRHERIAAFSAFITVLRSAFNQEADEAWRRAPSSSRSIEGLYGQVAREGLGRQPDRLQLMEAQAL
jgi:hypothetical protein